MDLVEALAVDGIVCVVGAGGKKTTLYELAGRVERAVVTATVRIPIFDEQVARVVVTDDPFDAVEATTAWPVGVVSERERPDRYAGFDPDQIDPLAGTDAGAVLVKADGARTRWLKAPDEHEPRIPAGADTVLPVASARVVGKPLDEDRVHRPALVADLLDKAVGDELTAEDVATVLASERGGLKDIPRDATVVAVVNMADDAERTGIAFEIGEAALARTDRIDRVAITKMDEGRLVGVLE
ncbi:selenium cofactor biosynthesis protein YqeC [Natronomonas sp. EA1]|uniref:selenium cofactor biosynthesis protein YqeC n=1 Tax=Natronomonas sp. EA1 TaxID=3421655 RepID=UPI003EB75A22